MTTLIITTTIIMFVIGFVIGYYMPIRYNSGRLQGRKDVIELDKKTKTYDNTRT